MYQNSFENVLIFSIIDVSFRRNLSFYKWCGTEVAHCTHVQASAMNLKSIQIQNCRILHFHQTGPAYPDVEIIETGPEFLDVEIIEKSRGSSMAQQSRPSEFLRSSRNRLPDNT